MTEQKGKQPASGERVIHQRCLCEEVFDRVEECLGITPEVREHLANSRVEFLKAIREVIDQRIARMSKQAQRGTKVAVE